MLKNLKAFKLGSLVIAVALMLTVGVSAYAETTTTTTTTTVNASAFTFSGTMRVGMSGPGVSTLQAALNSVNVGGTIVVDGAFGPATLAAVKQFQASKGLSADGVVGSLTGAALTAATYGVITIPAGPYPAGCNSNGGFSSTTGQSCAVSMTLPAGCSTSAGFSSTTGLSCAAVVTTLPAGCSSTAGFSTTTGASCSGGSVSTNTGPLAGGAGDVTVSKTSTDVQSEVAEGTSEKVLGFKVEADGSDLAITSAKLIFQEASNVTAQGAMSYRLGDYVDSVEIYKGSTKVATVDAADFTKDNTTYTKSVTLSNVVVREGAKDTFYVVVKAIANLDTADLDKIWDVTLDSVRSQDATGVIMSYDTVQPTEDFSFTSLAESNDVKLTISKASTSPAAGNVEISETKSTSDVPLLDFKLKAAGTDMSFDTLSVVLNSTGATTANMVDELFLYNGDIEIASTDTIGADGLATTFDLSDTFTIDADSTETFTVKATMKAVVGGTGTTLFDQGDSLIASLAQAGIEVEDQNGDVVDTNVGGATGSSQAFYFNGAMVTYVSGSYTAPVLGDSSADGTITLKFKVSAFGDNTVYVSDSTVAYSGDGAVTHSLVSGGPISDSIITSSDLTADDNGLFTVEAGDNATFTLSVKFTPTTGFVQLQITAVDGTNVSNIKTAAY